MKVVFLVLILTHYTSAFKLEPVDGRASMRQRRAATTNEAVLMYSTNDAIFECPFEAMSAGIKESSFRKVLSTKRYGVAAFSATYQENDNQLLYGKNHIFARPLQPGSCYLGSGSCESKQLSDTFNFDKDFTVDWVDYNVYTVLNRQVNMIGLHTQSRRVVYNISHSARNLMVDQVKHFVAWIANDVNILRINKDGSGEQTVWTESSRIILCMTIDSNRMRFYFFVNDVSPLEDDAKARYAILYSIDYDSEEKPVREGSLKYRAKGSNILHMAKYFEDVFVVMFEKDDEGDEIYNICKMLRHGERMMDRVLISKSWVITGLQVSWKYQNPPKHCHKDKNRCPYLCAHLHNDNTPMCLCKDNSDYCQQYLMTSFPPPTRAKPTNKKDKPSQSVSGEENGVWMWVIIVLIVILLFAGIYLVYLYFFDEDEEEGEGEGEGGEGEGEGEGLEGGGEEGDNGLKSSIAQPTAGSGKESSLSVASASVKPQKRSKKADKSKHKSRSRSKSRNKKRKRKKQKVAKLSSSSQLEGSKVESSSMRSASRRKHSARSSSRSSAK